ncbi:MAG: (cytosine-5)-methyltransferase 1 [Acidobacteriota bacterium]|nr:(cytosine-5)-methyltransferase 1 [Acidobacteriota bacterium]
MVRRVCERLEATYGRPRLGNPDDPLDDLVYVLLSNKSAPERAQKAYADLKARFASWHDISDVDLPEVVALLRPTGFATKRAGQLLEIFRRLKEDFGSSSLEELGKWEQQEVFDYLTSFKGVSDKVARCVMMYTMGFEVLPVDAHVHRVARRLGWTQIERPENSHDELEQLIPPNRRYAFHVDCIAHGRELCRAGKPICEPCIVKEYCDYFKLVVAAER